MGKCSHENNGYFGFWFFYGLERWLRMQINRTFLGLA